MDTLNNNNESTCGDTDSISDLDPRTLDLSNGDMSPINTKLLNIAAYNINSITNGIRREELESLAHQLNLAAICLTETKLDDTLPVSYTHLTLPTKA